MEQMKLVYTYTQPLVSTSVSIALRSFAYFLRALLAPFFKGLTVTASERNQLAVEKMIQELPAPETPAAAA